MYLMRVGEIGAERPVVGDGSGEHFDLSPIVTDLDRAFWATESLSVVRDALAQQALPKIDITGLRRGAPVANPGAVICIGQNFAAHAAESGSAPPTQPIIFFKHPNTICGPDDDVSIPPGAKKVDWEVELAVVIGQRARYLSSPAEAARHIAAVTISNDVSERDYQLDQSGGQWSKGKCCETFNPLGPWAVPYAEVPDIQDLRMRSWVNDEPRQDSTSSDMIFDVCSVIHHLSQFMVLDPGDIINTGTPQGVALSGRFPYLQPGDSMRMEIEGLGVQQQAVVSAEVSQP